MDVAGKLAQGGLNPLKLREVRDRGQRLLEAREKQKAPFDVAEVDAVLLNRGLNAAKLDLAANGQGLKERGHLAVVRGQLRKALLVCIVLKLRRRGAKPSRALGEPFGKGRGRAHKRSLRAENLFPLEAKLADQGPPVV